MSYNSESRFNLSSVTKIRYVILSDDAGISIPPLTCNVTGSQSLRAAHINLLSDIAYQLEESQSIQLGTDITIEIPIILDKHILIVGPPALPDSDPTMLVVYVYALKLDGNIAVASSDIMSVLKRVNSSSPFFKSLGSAYYGLEVYRRGNSNDVGILESDEYSVGAILYIVESNEDEGSMLRGNASQQCHVGSQRVAVLSSTAPIPFEDSSMNVEPILQEERKMGGKTDTGEAGEDIAAKKGGGIMEELDGQEESSHYHTIEEEETKKQLHELMVSHQKIAGGVGKMVLPAVSHKTLYSTNDDITELSSFNRTPSYSHTSPLSATDKRLVYNAPPFMCQGDNYCQPSISPPLPIPLHGHVASSISTVRYRAEQFPLSVKDLEHGTLIYSESYLENIIPSGRFSHLPKCEELAEYPLLGCGGNSNVIQYFIGGYEVALKYTKYRRETMIIWSELYHPNIIPLLGAFVIHSLNGRFYCQVMPKMTRSLRDEFKLIGGGILPALKSNKINPETLWRNFRYICLSDLRALDYIGRLGIALLDLKSSNMLVYQYCSCRSIFECGPDHRYVVQLSDFDFVCSSSGTFRTCPVHLVQRKTFKELVTVVGTPGYRAAPENFLKLCDCDGVNVIGPWTDMWSFGVFLIEELNGRDYRIDVVSEAKKLCGNFEDSSSSFDPNKSDIVAELISILLKRIELCRELNSDKLVEEVLEMVNACLKADCNKRATPAMLYNFSFFRH